MFCKKCGSILLAKGKKTVCSNCGYVSKDKPASLKEEIKQKSVKIEIIKKEETETLPTTEVDCSKCGHNQAYYWTIQTRAGDEGETKFLKCKNCNHTWRDYG